MKAIVMGLALVSILSQPAMACLGGNTKELKLTISGQEFKIADIKFGSSTPSENRITNVFEGGQIISILWQPSGASSAQPYCGIPGAKIDTCDFDQQLPEELNVDPYGTLIVNYGFGSMREATFKVSGFAVARGLGCGQVVTGELLD